jgi:hypothetical protein
MPERRNAFCCHEGQSQPRWSITQRTVSPADMSVDIDMKACTILERFGAELLDAEVDYCCTMDLHEFSITRGGLTHEVGFTERVLQLKDIPDIEEVVAKLAEEIKASTQPRKIRVGSRASDSASLVGTTAVHS